MPVLEVAAPIALAARPGTGQRYVATLTGQVWLLDPADGRDAEGGADAEAAPQLVVDIGSRVSEGCENGLLGITFSPDGSQLFLSYTDTARNSRIAVMPMDGETPQADRRRVLLALDQPACNHNGGDLTFGPDGNLWIGFGDGGGADDVFGQGQDRNTLLAAIARIDPNPAAGQGYGIPAGNPFASGDAPEVWAYGARNPWRFSFDRLTGDLWIADVGQSRIEEIIGRAREQIDRRLLSEGQQAVNELKLKSMHPEMMKLVGRLRFRSSYGQNALDHSKEVAFLTGMMAAEIGLDEILARRCGLLHDVGKALDHEMEGSHPEIGLAFAEKYGEPEEVKNAIIAHHNDENEEITSPITFLVAAADAISGARPGARRNDPEDYVRRVVELEELARSFDGVADAYAINAGREIRVMVRPDQVDDDRTHTLASEISQKIRNDLTYPGHIKVTVIREKIAHRMTNKRDDQQSGGRRRSYGRNRNRRDAPASSGQAAG